MKYISIFPIPFTGTSQIPPHPNNVDVIIVLHFVSGIFNMAMGKKLATRDQF